MGCLNVKDEEKIKLSYFGGNGRASIARAILSIYPNEFIDSKIDMEHWLTVKQSGYCEFQQLPILEYNGKKYSQSLAIDLLLAKKFKLYGNDIEEDYQIDSLLCTFDDLFSIVTKIAFAFTDEAKKEIDSNKKALIDKLKLYYGVFERRYNENGNGKYFLGNRFTLADIYLTVLVNNIHNLIKDECPLNEVAPNLAKLVQRIKENELKLFFEKYFINEAPF